MKLNNYTDDGAVVTDPKYYSGHTMTHTARLVIDLKKPTHCSVGASCTDNMLDRGPPVTKTVSCTGPHARILCIHAYMHTCIHHACAQMRAGAFKCKCKRRIKCKCKCKCATVESNASANANAQQLNQMQMQMHLDQIQMHLDQMQMVFYNYVFLRSQVIFC